MSNQIFYRNLETLRSWCAIDDNKYWNITLQDDERTVNTSSNKNLCIENADGYGITMKPNFMGTYQGCINGYVKIPQDSQLMDWVQKHPSYDAMNDYADLPVEMTFFNLLDQTFGWDHFHCYDADLFKLESEQPDKLVSGPVQVLDEARQVIAEFRAKDEEIKMAMKEAQVNILREELMMKTCHPHRIAAWTEQGFDPFP
jgi:hypothetical protein